MQTWHDIAIVHRGERIAIDGVGFSAIGRLELLQLLQRRARAGGVEMRFGRPVGSLDELGACDLIVAADGVNSLARRTFARELGATEGSLDARFAWYGTSQWFDTLTQTFVASDLGTFNAHHYRYAPGMSTFIVECDPATWVRAGLDKAGDEASRRICEGVFAAALQGHPLSSNGSVWRSFRWVWNERWWYRNVVLIGDALHTAHYSIGSGTRLAMEDALALAKALETAPGDLPAALSRYQAERKPIVEKLVAASRRSAAWYERFPEHMRLAPVDLAMSYIQRSGRIDAGRLHTMAPNFMMLYERTRGLA
jgi:2-polyprenyl-6-methoxyphenol hydroxylase-like FAD-dependent oxidoreductase